MFTAIWSGPPNQELETAVALARGVPGMMRPSPDAAESEDALNLLRYAAAIARADEPTPPKKPEWKPKWFWNLVSKLALRYWQWKYKGLAENRIREWYESRSTPIASIRPKPMATARSHANSAPPLQPNPQKDLNR